MKYVKWIFVVLLIGSLTSFVEKDKPTGGLNVGDIAPDFKIQSMSAGQPLAELSDMKGKYVLLSFWASYDAHSRMQNASLSNVLRSASRNENVEMVSVSFDEYQSIFKETVRKDQIVTPTCFVETKGESSGLFKKYRLGRGFTNYLLDENVEMVSVSFDEYQSIFKETVRKDQIVTPTCFVETKGESSGLFKKYRLGRGFTNYLLDENGVIIAKNISAAELSAYLN